MGQFSVEIYDPPGSHLGGNQQQGSSLLRTGKLRQCWKAASFFLCRIKELMRSRLWPEDGRATVRCRIRSMIR